VTLQNLKAGRAPLADFNRWVDSLVASYRREIDRNVPVVKGTSWIAHIVQKEAIQNSSDALDSYSSDKWGVTFEVDENFPIGFIAITDEGTSGLTGKAFVSKEELDTLEAMEPQKYQQERWARFEALSFPNIDPSGRGSKGQGKWAFIGASKKKTIVYDTLRKDKVYRAGGWLGQKQLMQKPLEGPLAKALMKKEFGLDPLERVGTRIVITEPQSELMEGFYPLNKSQIGQYIKETWWELLKNGATIVLRRGTCSVEIVTPSYYSEEFIQKNGRSVWVARNCDLYWEKNTKVKAKELAIIHTNTVIPEGFRGISIQRNRMKIRSFDVQLADPRITPEMAEHIYGWISFNDAGEKELRAIEDTTHYDFTTSTGTFGNYVFGRNGWLAKQIREFAEQKLGLGSRNKSRSERFDTLAVNKLNKFARKHNLEELGKIVRPALIKKTTYPPSEIRIIMPKPTFPHPETRRIEHGETVSAIKASVANDSGTSRRVRMTLVLKTTSRKAIPERVLKTFVAVDLVVPSNGESECFGPYEIKFSKEKYDDGTYALEAEIVLLEGDVMDEKFGKSMILDQERELIYLNEDPPTGRGLFELIDRVEFKYEKALQYRVKEKDRKFRIEINTLHPAYKHAEEIDDFLTKHVEQGKHTMPNPLLDYDIIIGAEAIALYDLKKEANLISNENEKSQFVRQRTDDKNAFYEVAMDRASRLSQEIRHEVL
jgi:hypothetical protein